MGRFPAGRTIRQPGSVTTRIPVPLGLVIVFGVNALILAGSLLLLMTLHQGLTFGAGFDSLQELLLVGFGLLMSGMVLWTIGTNRRLSRALTLVNSGALLVWFAIVAINRFELAEWLVGTVMTLCALATVYILFFSEPVQRYYQVLAGTLSIEEYEPYSARFVARTLAMGDKVALVSEIVVVLLVLGAVILGVAHMVVR